MYCNMESRMSEFAIQVKHLDKMYKLYNKPSDRLKEALGFKVPVREHYALRDVSFEVRRGETVGIIGTNGSGKSTILKIITGVLNPTGGEVTVDGRISALLELGAGFNMEYTGIENVYLNGTMMGFSKEEIDSRLQDILDFADIGDFVHQPVKAYSSGMFVRLAFAVAINIDPEILIVDEALSVGDVFFQAKCYRKFEEFKKMGRTILFVSHDLSSIARYCDRVVLLNKGVKLEEGSPKQMVDMYKQLLVGQDPTKQQVQEEKPKESWSEEFQVNIVAFTTLPLQFVTVAGGICFLGSLLLIIYSLVQYFSGHAVEGYTTTLLVLLLIGSAIMLSLGIIGYYIAKIYEEVKRRPRYIVSRIMRGGEDVSETARHDGR